ncbi:hypothetical protein [Thermophilibacter sp.]|uniref:hypothetical protein n=1 Tax=Thermophilibacter sp. TaxID=2847309 RepID=UPI003A8F6637
MNGTTIPFEKNDEVKGGLSAAAVRRYEPLVANGAIRSLNGFLAGLRCPEGEVETFAPGVRYLCERLDGASHALLERSGFFSLASEEERARLLESSPEATLGMGLQTSCLVLRPLVKSSMEKYEAVRAEWLAADDFDDEDEEGLEYLPVSELSVIVGLVPDGMAQALLAAFHTIVHDPALEALLDVMASLVDGDIEKEEGGWFIETDVALGVAFMCEQFLRFAESHRGEQSLVEISEDRLNLRDGGDPVLDGLYDHVGDDGWFASLSEDERRRLEAWSSGEGFEACFALTLLTIGMLAGNVRDNAAVRVVNR